MRSKVSVTLAVLSALLIALPSSPGLATHVGSGRTCAGAGSTAPLANPVVGQENVDDGEVNKYKVVLTAGQTGYFMMQPLNGDIDVYVCRVGGGGAHACASPNMYPIGDGCHFEELDLYVPDENGIRVMDWGNALQQAGTYWIHIQQCWSSQDIPDGGAQGACDYATLVDPTLEGALDPLPPVEYIYGWTIQ